MFYYLNIFYIYSVFGYVLETLLLKNYKSGILFLPWTPLYGIGVLIGIFICKKIKGKFHKFWEIPILFFTSAIVLSIVEFIAGHSIEFFFNKIYWNYDNLKFNLGKYVSLEAALIWGVVSIVGIYIILPLIKKIEKYIPKWVTSLLTGAFILDLFITCLVKMP